MISFCISYNDNDTWYIDCNIEDSSGGEGCCCIIFIMIIRIIASAIAYFFYAITVLPTRAMGKNTACKFGIIGITITRFLLLAYCIFLLIIKLQQVKFYVLLVISLVSIIINIVGLTIPCSKSNDNNTIINPIQNNYLPPETEQQNNNSENNNLLTNNYNVNTAIPSSQINDTNNINGNFTAEENYGERRISDCGVAPLPKDN